jgi:hypothetical protein
MSYCQVCKVAIEKSAGHYCAIHRCTHLGCNQVKWQSQTGKFYNFCATHKCKHRGCGRHIYIATIQCHGEPRVNLHFCESHKCAKSSPYDEPCDQHTDHTGKCIKK